MNNIKNRLLLFGAAIILLSLLFIAAGYAAYLLGKRKENAILIAGSSLMLDMNRELAQEFNKRSPRTQITVEKGGSEAAVLALSKDTLDLAAIDQPVSREGIDTPIRKQMVARNSLAFVVNKANPIKSLTQSKVQELLSGQIKNWKELGGDDLPIVLLRREKTSNSQQYIDHFIMRHQSLPVTAQTMQNAEEMASTVGRDKAAFGYLSLNEIPRKNKIQLLQINGIRFHRSTILSSRYPYIQDLYLASTSLGSEKSRDFLKFLQSPTAQEIIERHNFISTY